MSYPNRYRKEFSMDIIALFCDINHFLFLISRLWHTAREAIRQVRVYTSAIPKKVWFLLGVFDRVFLRISVDFFAV